MSKKARSGSSARPSARNAPSAAGVDGALAAAARADLSADVRRGVEAFRAGDFSTTIDAWRRIRRAATPESAVQIERALAEAYFRRSLLAETPSRALRDLEEACSLAPTNATYHYHLGLVATRLGQPRRAAAALAEAVGIDPDSERFRFHLALLIASSASSRSDADAERARARQILAESRAPDTRNQRLAALLYLREGNAERAVASLLAIREASPLNHLALGLANLRSSEQSAAPEHLRAGRESLNRAADKKTSLGRSARLLASLGLAWERLAAGDFASSAKVLESLKPSEFPDEPSLKAIVVSVNRRLGRELARDGSRPAIDSAVRAWRRAYQANPDDKVTARGLANLLEVAGTLAVRAGDNADAHRHWTSALAAEPGDTTRLRQNLALVAERLSHWFEATEHWEALIREWKRTDSGPKTAAVSRGSTQHVDPARALRAVAYQHLASAYEEIDAPADAARALERALQSGLMDPPDELAIRRRLSSLYRELEQPSKAIEHLKRMLAEKPNDVATMIQLGSALGAKGEDREAIDCIERALALDPTNPATREALADQYCIRADRLTERKLFERAIADYLRAIDLDPDDSGRLLSLGRACVKNHQATEAEAAFARSINLDPHDWETRAEIGTVYLKAGDKARADAHFRAALRLAPKKVGAALVISFSYLIERDHAGAEPYLARILKSRNAAALFTVGGLLVKNREYAPAIPFLERAIKVSREDESLVHLHYMLGTAFAMGPGDHARAEIELEKAKRIASRQGDFANVARLDSILESNAYMAEKQERANEARQRRARA